MPDQTSARMKKSREAKFAKDLRPEHEVDRSQRTQRKARRLLRHRADTVRRPAPFADQHGWPVDEQALRTYVRFLLDNGLTADYATLLAGGAAGDFSTMTFEERVRVAEVVADEADGAVPLTMGAQTTSTLELERLAKARQGRLLDRHRFHPDLLPLLLHPYRGGLRGVREGRCCCSPRRRRDRLQHVLDLDQSLVCHGRTSRRHSEYRRPQMGDTAYRCDGIRGRHLALFKASPSSTTISSSR